MLAQSVRTLHNIFQALAVQTLAALAELLIPHYVSASIFSIANKLPASTFHNNVKMLAVSRTDTAQRCCSGNITRYV